MSFLEFLGDLAATGRILGRGVDTTTDGWSGVDPAHEESIATFSGALCHFYGLIDVWFERDGDAPWECLMANVRVIQRYPGETLCPAVRDRYGDAPDRVPVGDLLAYTGRAGLEVHRVRRHDDVAFDRFWYPAARVEVAAAAPYHVEEYGYRLGDVYSVTAVRYTVEPERREPITAPAGK